jgi:hypothetical protein
MLSRRNAKREADLQAQGLENNHSKGKSPWLGSHIAQADRFPAFDDMTDLQNQDFRYSV